MKCREAKNHLYLVSVYFQITQNTKVALNSLFLFDVSDSQLSALFNNWNNSCNFSSKLALKKRVLLFLKYMFFGV